MSKEQNMRSRRIAKTLFAAVVVCIGGCILDPGARDDLQELRTRVDSLGTEAVAVADQIQRVKATIDEARESGDWSKLAPLLNEYDELQTRATQIAQDTVAAQGEIEQLIDEHDVPGWQVALYMLGTLLAGAGGTAIVGAVPLGRARQTATMAQAAVRALMGAIKAEGDQAEGVKQRMKHIQDPVVEQTYRDMKRAEATRGDL
jgi:hypothetical protein